MNVIAYLESATTIGYELQCALERVLPDETLIICYTSAELAIELSISHRQPEILILLASSQNELDRILEMKMLLRDRKIILILPDDSQASFACGCMLFPRFICDINCDFKDIIAVLKKMMSTCSVH